MTIAYELDLNSFEAWSGGEKTLDRVINSGKCSELENLLEENYPDGMTETELNDLLRFNSEWIYESLGIETIKSLQEKIDELYDEISDLNEEIDGVEEEIKELKESISMCTDDAEMEKSELEELEEKRNDLLLKLDELHGIISEYKEEQSYLN